MPSSSLRKKADGEGKSKVLLDRIAKCFGDASQCIETAKKICDVASLIDYPHGGTIGKIIFIPSRTPRDVFDIDKVLGDLSQFQDLLDALKVNEKATNRKSEEARIKISDYRSNLLNAADVASGAKSLAKNPKLTRDAQASLRELDGLLRLVQANIVELKKYESVIANWSDLVDTSSS
jgi:hypothetical protein